MMYLPQGRGDAEGGLCPLVHRFFAASLRWAGYMPNLPKYMIYPIAKAGHPRVMNGDTEKFHLPHITNPN